MSARHLLWIVMAVAWAACSDDEKQDDPVIQCSASYGCSSEPCTKPGFSPGCCFEGVGCCPCFFCDGAPDSLASYGSCLCRPDVCGLECGHLCGERQAGGSFACEFCMRRGAESACAEPAAACGDSVTCTTHGYDECWDCTQCALVGGCYGALVACSRNVNCSHVLDYAGSDFTPSNLMHSIETLTSGWGKDLARALVECLACNECAAACADTTTTSLCEDAGGGAGGTGREGRAP